MPANSTTGRAVAGELPPGFCPTSWQNLFNTFASLLQIIVSNTLGINIGPDLPDVGDQDKPWLRTNPDGSFDAIYCFVSGAWVSPNAIEPSSDFRCLWVGDENTLKEYDGGDTNPAGDYSGPMWEIDTDYGAKFPLFCGTLPSGTVVNVGDEGGEEKHTMTVDELVEHEHNLELYLDTPEPDIFPGVAYQSNGAKTTVATESTGESQPFPILPPYKALYLIKRTTRIGYKV